MKKVLAIVLLLGLRAAIPAAAEVICKPVLPVPPPTGQFGCSVALHGSSLVVGSNLDVGGSITACRQAQDGSWSCVGEGAGKVTASDGRPGDEFGRSAWIDGNWLAVGAPFANSPQAGGAGVVYLFQRQDETSPWLQKQKLYASDGARGDQFGLTLALSGNTLVVGAPNAVGTAGSLSGAVYVFQYDGTTWKPLQKLTAGDAAAFDNFGFSLALDGSTLVVGAPFHDRGSAAGNAGTAYVFQSDDSNNWSQKAQMLADDGAADDEYGSSVSVSGDTVVIGARAGDVNELRDAGSAYVYQGSGATWNPGPRFFGVAAGDHFGAAVSVSGNRMLIGALLHGGGAGAAYLFTRPKGTTQWAPEAVPFSTDEVKGRFGQAVSVDGKNLLVGAYLAPNGAGSATSPAPGSATVCGPSNPIPIALSVRNTDHHIAVSRGLTLSYKITVTNPSGRDTAAVQVTDTVSDKLRDVSWSLQGSPADGTHPGALDRTIPLASHASRIFNVMGTVKPDATGTITNHACAQVSGQETSVCRDDEPDEVGCSGDVHLTLVKTAPAAAKPGQRITYRLTVTNQGTCPATGVVLKDPIPENLQAVGTSGCGIASGTIVCALPDLAPQASTMVSLPFDVLETCAPAIVNHATISANEEDPVSSNQVSTNVVRVANLTLTKTGPATVKPGDSVPYTLTVTNQGPDIACGVVLSDPTPAGLASPTGPCQILGNGVSCAVGELAAHAFQTFPVSFTASPVASCGAQIVNRATVSADPPSADPNPADDVGLWTTAIPDPDVSITKAVSRATASPGDALTYTIVVSNPGGFPATVTDLFPAGLTQVRWCRDGNVVPCGPFQVGDLHDVLNAASATYRVEGVVAPMFPRTIDNTATVAGPLRCVDPDLTNNSATATTEIVLAPGVTVLCKGIEGSQTAGGAITYTFLLLNGGPAAQMDNPGNEFTDLLPTGLTPIAASATSGTVTLGNPVTWNGAIPVGGMVTITITAMIGPGALGTTFCNVPTIAFDRDGDGINESTGAVVPCCFPLTPPVPTLSGLALMVLALLLTVAALRLLRRRSSL